MLKVLGDEKHNIHLYLQLLYKQYMKIEKAIKSTQEMSISTKTVINLIHTSRVIEEAISSELKPFDLTIQQYNVLRILRGQKGNPANLSTLQERMVDRNSNTTRLIDKLIKKGWVVRQVCAENRRKIEIFITKNGLDLLKQLDPITESKNKRMLQHVSGTELDILNETLNNVRTI